MKLSFRQGIARYQTDVYSTPEFLVKSASGDFIDLIVSPDPTIIVFAHKSATYVVEESKTVASAWGPFPNNGVGGTKYLYWDINLLDASLTRGFTIYPVIIGSAPSNPAVDQHWFDTAASQMKLWNGNKWVEKVRVFAATYSSSAVIIPSPLGTQVGAVGNFDAGNLVLDAFNKPLRQSDGSFVTDATLLSVVNAASKKVKFEAEIIAGMANEYIPKYSFVQSRPNQTIILARSDDWKSRIIGLVEEDLYQSEVGNVTSDGLVRNEQWNWPIESVGRPVFCGLTGQVTITPPATGVNQVAGYIYNTDSIYIDVQAVTIIDNIVSVLPPAPTNPELGPIADFSASPLVGTAPLSVTFTSTSIHAPTHIEWDIGNTGTIESILPSFTHEFTQPGNYDVRLRAENNYGADEIIKTAVVQVSAAPTKGLKTNIGIQLGGPLQVAAGQVFTIAVTMSNDGHLAATDVLRTVEVDDVLGMPVTIVQTPTGSTTTHVASGTTVIVLATVPLATGQFSNANIKLSAPTNGTPINIRASVSSPEADSTLSDNSASLSVKVKP